MRHRGIATTSCFVIAKNTFAKFVKFAEYIFAEFVKFADLIRRLYATVTAVPDAVTINMPLFSPRTS